MALSHHCPARALSHWPMSLTALCPRPWTHRHHTGFPSFPRTLWSTAQQCRWAQHCTEHRQPGCQAHTLLSPGASSLLPNYGNSRAVSTSKHKEQIPMPVRQLANTLALSEAMPGRGCQENGIKTALEEEEGLEAKSTFHSLTLRDDQPWSPHGPTWTEVLPQNGTGHCSLCSSPVHAWQLSGI